MLDSNVISEYLEFNGNDSVNSALTASAAGHRHCAFDSASLECGHFGGDFLACHFRDIECYWGLFHDALFVDRRFDRCTFRGTSFVDCRFLECIFNDCQFLPDNLGSTCTAQGSQLYACAASDSTGWNALFQPCKR